MNKHDLRPLPPSILASLSVAHPLATLFMLIWVQVQNIDGQRIDLDDLADRMSRAAKRGGRIPLLFTVGKGDASVYVSIQESPRGDHWVVATEVAWSSSTYTSADALKIAELHLAVSRLAALIDAHALTLIPKE